MFALFKEDTQQFWNFKTQCWDEFLEDSDESMFIVDLSFAALTKSLLSDPCSLVELLQDDAMT